MIKVEKKRNNKIHSLKCSDIINSIYILKLKFMNDKNNTIL